MFVSRPFSSLYPANHFFTHVTRQGELLEEEWSPIIMYMYNNTDSEIIHEQLFDLIRANHERALEMMPDGPRAETTMMREQILQAIRKGRIPFTTVLKVRPGKARIFFNKTSL